VLIESDKLGRTEHYLPVSIAGDVPGVVRRRAIVGHDGSRLMV
jgi:threonylcarbamoyladenosine tRNA methylthiotransferase MtaB